MAEQPERAHVPIRRAVPVAGPGIDPPEGNGAASVSPAEGQAASRPKANQRTERRTVVAETSGARNYGKRERRSSSHMVNLETVMGLVGLSNAERRCFIIMLDELNILSAKSRRRVLDSINRIFS